MAHPALTRPLATSTPPPRLTFSSSGDLSTREILYRGICSAVITRNKIDMANGNPGEVLPNCTTSIAGAWVLDVNRSDTMAEYLRILGSPEFAIQEQVKRERESKNRNAIVLNESVLVIYRRTAMTSFTLTYILGEELVTDTLLGLRKSTAHWGERGQLDGFVITSNFGSLAGEVFMVESWKLTEEGRTHEQEINIRNLNTGLENVTRRVWVRVPMTDDDREHLLE